MSKRFLSLSLTFLLILNLLAFIPHPKNVFVKADSQIWNITNTDYDAWMAYDDPDPKYSESYLYARQEDTWWNDAGLVWLNIPIPSGSTILSANVSVYCSSAGGDDPYFVAYGHDVDSATDFNSDTTDIKDRDRTSDSHSVSSDNIGDGWFTFNVTDCVIEIVARSGWSSGSNLGILLIGNRVDPSKAIRFYDLSGGGGSYPARLGVEWTPPPATPQFDSLDLTYDVLDIITHNDYHFLNASVSFDDGLEDIVNCTIGLSHGIILKYDNATDTFSEYADPSSYVTLNATDSERNDDNSTHTTLSWSVKFSGSMPNGYKSAFSNSTLIFETGGNNGSYSSGNWFMFYGSNVHLHIEDEEFEYAFSNVTGDVIYDYDGFNEVSNAITYDNSTLATRSLSDFGSTVTNYATLYVIGYEFVYGWSDTLYDIYRSQAYECVGEPAYNDWNYNGLIPMGSIPQSYSQADIPWYVPIIGYLVAVLLPFMIIAYYWNKARDWKTGLMVLFVCIMCYILFMVLWNLSDALMYYMYQ